MYNGSTENPRFPHTLTVKRAPIGTDGLPTTDSDGNVTYTTILTSSFGYRNENTVRNSGDVLELTEKLALPKTTTPIYANDVVEISDYTETYKALVVKAKAYNLGTNIWIRRAEN